ncbi:hypothetical protein OEZ86_007233 [Tetradesmus obliquus]|nr:hypothetical protein OEZ86_007233 [Tetradesmus obliquus]
MCYICVPLAPAVASITVSTVTGPNVTVDTSISVVKEPCLEECLLKFSDCTTYQCNTTSSQCSVTFNQGACSLGGSAGVDGVCSNGVCVNATSPPPTCPNNKCGPALPCNGSLCDSATGNCIPYSHNDKRACPVAGGGNGTCISSQCVANNNNATDPCTACPSVPGVCSGSSCVNKTCVPFSQNDNRTCSLTGGGSGICVSGQCVATTPPPNPCAACGTLPGACSGTTCLNGQCVPQTVADKTPCNTAAGTNTGTCSSGTCVSNCAGKVCSSTTCKPMVCNPQDGTCIPAAVQPTSTTQCDAGSGAGTGTCNNGNCVSKCAGVSCAAQTNVRGTFTCTPTTGKCAFITPAAPAIEYKSRAAFTAESAHSSSDNGGTWKSGFVEDVGPKFGTWAGRNIAASADGTVLIAAKTGGKVWKSTDRCKQDYPARLSEGDVHVSANGGVSWSRNAPPGNAAVYWLDVLCDGTGKYVVATAYSPQQVYISSDFGATFTQANINGGADRSWAAVPYSRDGSTLVAAAGSSVELRRVAAKALGSRVANRAEQQMQQSRRSAKPAETDQADTVWWSCAISDDGSTMAATATSGWLYIGKSGLWIAAAQNFISRVLLLNNGARLFGQQADLRDASEEYGGLILASGNFKPKLAPTVGLSASPIASMAASYDGKHRYAIQTRGYIWSSSDSGATWLPVLDSSPLSGGFNAIASSADGSIVIAAGQYGPNAPGQAAINTVYRSVDSGANWKSISDPGDISAALWLRRSTDGA